METSGDSAVPNFHGCHLEGGHFGFLQTPQVMLSPGEEKLPRALRTICLLMGVSCEESTTTKATWKPRGWNFDNDGDLDLLITNHGGGSHLRLYENLQGSDSSWAIFRVEGTVRYARRMQLCGNWEVKLAPPVNKVLPLSRDMETVLMERLGF